MQFCTGVDISDVVTPANFGSHRFRRFRMSGVEFQVFPLTFNVVLITPWHYRGNPGGNPKDVCPRNLKWLQFSPIFLLKNSFNVKYLKDGDRYHNGVNGSRIWNHVCIRGVRVYPYPRVYPTRPIPAGMGRVRVDVLRVGSSTGTKSTGTGIPVFTRKEHHFTARLYASAVLAVIVCLSVCPSVCHKSELYKDG